MRELATHNYTFTAQNIGLIPQVFIVKVILNIYILLKKIGNVLR